jgi:hypothetical protein
MRRKLPVSNSFTHLWKGIKIWKKTWGTFSCKSGETEQRGVAAYFNLLVTVLEEYDLLDKPHMIYNMDESGFPVNIRPLKNC